MPALKLCPAKRGSGGRSGPSAEVRSVRIIPPEIAGQAPVGRSGAPSRCLRGRRAASTRSPAFLTPNCSEECPHLSYFRSPQGRCPGATAWGAAWGAAAAPSLPPRPAPSRRPARAPAVPAGRVRARRGGGGGGGRLAVGGRPPP